MLQPPPSPEVMKGKKKPLRSRSGSGGSALTSVSAQGASLPRGVSERLLEQKLHGATASGSSLPLPSALDAIGSDGQPYDRSAGSSSTDRIDFATQAAHKRERRRPSPLHLNPAESSEESTATVVRSRHLAPEHAQTRVPRRTASRPQLSTITSDSVVPSRNDVEFHIPAPTPKENSLPDARASAENDSSGSYDKDRRRSALVVKDGARLLQEERPKHITFNTAIFATSPAGLKHRSHDGRMPQDVRHPVSYAPQSVDGEDDARSGIGGPELFDSWYTPDFELGEWVHEHTKREVNQRWSMDI